jgi:hypothetical protein
MAGKTGLEPATSDVTDLRSGLSNHGLTCVCMKLRAPTSDMGWHEMTQNDTFSSRLLHAVFHTRISSLVSSKAQSFEVQRLQYPYQSPLRARCRFAHPSDRGPVGQDRLSVAPSAHNQLAFAVYEPRRSSPHFEPSPNRFCTSWQSAKWLQRGNVAARTEVTLGVALFASVATRGPRLRAGNELGGQTNSEFSSPVLICCGVGTENGRSVGHNSSAETRIFEDGILALLALDGTSQFESTVPTGALFIGLGGESRNLATRS